MDNNILKNSSKTIVAYFDFDGTITSFDTFIIFLIYVTGWPKFLIKLPRLLKVAFLYLFKFVNNEVAKEQVLTIMIKGYPEDFIEKKAFKFALKKIGKYIKPDVYTRLQYHYEHGHKILVVSANLAIYLRYWASQHKIDGVIGTEIEFKDGVCTGKLATKNCYAKQKVARILHYLEDNDLTFDYSYGYGNSQGDRDLLNYVDEGYWVTRHEILVWKSHAASIK